MKLENATFWEVMDHLCNTTGLVMYHNEGQGMMLYQNEGFWPHVCYRGPFKIVANNFSFVAWNAIGTSQGGEAGGDFQ